MTEKPVAIPPELIKLLDPAEQAAARKRKLAAERQQRSRDKRAREQGIIETTVRVPRQQTKTIRACAAFLRKYPNAELDFTDPEADD